ncbi:MAG: peptidylprolyl isomerase [Azospira oryzae]|uniref:peptidylprolyl isomerase n=1 Tax=Pelomicrobium methylotrophicum TaxID=2602750 RepID=A0A5C7EYZ8_9PROT|nr:peptidylprolyl isomerase [Pelomicrobium methylotrophicum]PZP58808.1 MAG: peptidylprolyl isomerase [Azospira oryzae]PZP79997.1 MAG: peptidylprolyl isomerase [Azospira oryzae]TXF12348.1 peptidylprolyl isomerase [Pelomicrobium methylotrophicum]
MIVAKNTVVTLLYRLFDGQGNLIEESQEPVSYLHGGYHGIFPLVEEALEGKQPGDRCSVTMEPENAFGEYDAGLVRVEDRALFPPEVRVGMQFEGRGEQSGDVRIFTVTDVAEDKVVVDGNHPLAGMRLRFDCQVTEVRAATPEEIAHGHAHGPHGHPH